MHNIFVEVDLKRNTCKLFILICRQMRRLVVICSSYVTPGHSISLQRCCMIWTLLWTSMTLAGPFLLLLHQARQYTLTQSFWKRYYWSFTFCTVQCSFISFVTIISCGWLYCISFCPLQILLHSGLEVTNGQVQVTLSHQTCFCLDTTQFYRSSVVIKRIAWFHDT